jgi:hypothetical protein
MFSLLVSLSLHRQSCIVLSQQRLKRPIKIVIQRDLMFVYKLTFRCSTNLPLFSIFLMQGHLLSSSFGSLCVPTVVMMCIRHLEQFGMHTVGIFRVSSSKKRVRQVRMIKLKVRLHVRFTLRCKRQ